MNIFFLFSDINECEDPSTFCGVFGTCRNTIGSAICTCDDGFQLEADNICRGKGYNLFYSKRLILLYYSKTYKIGPRIGVYLRLGILVHEFIVGPRKLWERGNLYSLNCNFRFSVMKVPIANTPDSRYI